MKTEIKKLENSIVALTIEESAENLLKFRKKVIENIRQNADIKGFRKGAHIPEEIIIKNYGEERIAALTVEEALAKLYTQALKENNILPISQGEVVEIISQSPMKLVMHVEVFPEIEIDKKYKKVKITKTPVEIGKDEVENALAEIQQKFTKFEEAASDYTTQMGDRVTITTQGFDSKGKELENTNMTSYPIVLGSNMLVPGFEEGLVGFTAGSEVKLDITFPKDYHNADFAGKKTKFQVTIEKIEASKKPEFTPEFIKDLRGKELDLAGFKALIQEEILETKEMNARLEDENKLMDELFPLTTLNFGPALLKNQVEKVYAEIKDNINQSGAKPADYIASLGLTEEQYIEKNVTPIAEKRLKAELILHKLSELEKTEVSEKELEAEIEKIIAKFQNAEVVSRLKTLYVPGTRYYEELKQRHSYRKLIDSFFA
jgi:trigger factor